MANPYITLTTSTGTVKRFKVVMSSWAKTITKNQTRRRTVSGTSDNSEGRPLTAWAMTVRVRNMASGTDPEGSQWGTLADLETFYGYNNPNGTPTNQFTLTDPGGATATVELVGRLTPDLITPVWDGANSWQFVTLQLEKVNS